MKYHNYIFLQPTKEFSKIPKIKLNEYKKEFLKVLISKSVVVHAYTTRGLKANTSIMMWMQSDTLEENQNCINQFMHTDLGKHLEITHTLFGMTRPTQYARTTTHLDTQRKGGKYLIVYPFTKTKEWYQIGFEDRKKMMFGHAAIGKQHPGVTQLLLYSYGIDDNEFIVSYETDDLMDFQTLVMELRSDATRLYTQKDTPIFTCIYRSAEETLNFL